jgi:DNA-binding NarL/FixJ family response regulator
LAFLTEKTGFMGFHQQPIRLFIIDDHVIVRVGLSMLLEGDPRTEVVAQASNAREALDSAAPCDVILLDLDLGADNGLDLIAPLLAKHAGARILVLTGMRDSQIQRKAIELGAMGIVLKEHACEALIKAVECVHRGELWMDRAMTAHVISGLRSGEKADPEAAKIETLTERERKVVTLIGEGLKNKEIAARLFLSETTVRHHLTSIFSKLEVSDRLELVIYAYRHKLIDSVK